MRVDARMFSLSTEKPITEAGVRITSASESSTSAPGSQEMAALPFYNLMEDAATAEISRSQCAVDAQPEGCSTMAASDA